MYTGEGINQERRGAISLEDSEIIRLYWERNEPAADLPEEYDFSYHASYEDTLAAARYLKETYAGLTGMEDPQINVCGGDCDIYGSRSYRVELYENGGSLAEKIVNCHFRRAVFYCDEAGRLCGMRLYCPDLSEKVGDYPLITAEEARELLVRGGYVSSVPYEMPGEEYVAKSELVYRTGRGEEYFMPYYRFYVELPQEERDGGLKTYGAYYVPAVDGAYIAGLPQWDGRFNG